VRAALVLRRMVLRTHPSTIDAEVEGLKLRLYPEGNVCERKFLFMPRFFDPDERALIDAELPPDGVFVDVGANVDCKPDHLVQFAFMGHEYAKRVNGLPSPRVGLLSVGEEESKGTSITRDVHATLKASPTINFIGNVEGRDIFNGNADVIVCDGFIGNVALKTSEGLAEAMMLLLRREIVRSPVGKLGYLLLKPAFDRFRKKVSYAEYGGAPLLGLNGISIICHGRSDPWAIRNALGVAKRMHDEKVGKHIVADIADETAAG
jgi:glycerol-3-phosphate acyltransferase PlsX